MTCKFCGNEIPDGSDVCYICGQPIAQESEPEAQPAPEEAVYNDPQPAQAAPVAAAPVAQPQEPKKEKKKKSKVKDPNRVGRFLLFICALMPLIGALVYLKNRKKPERKTSIANATFVGLNIYLAIIIFVLAKKWF